MQKGSPETPAKSHIHLYHAVTHQAPEASKKRQKVCHRQSKAIHKQQKGRPAPLHGSP